MSYLRFDFFSGLIARVSSWALFSRRPEPASAAPPLAPIIVPSPHIDLPALALDADEEAPEGSHFGTMVEMGNLLDHVDNYFHYLKHLKRDHPDAFDLYSRVGGRIINSDMLFMCDGLSDEWLASRPSFGMCQCGSTAAEGIDDTKWVSVKLIFYNKLKRFANVQPINEDIYEVVAYYSDKKGRVRFPGVFYVFVGPDGSVRLLKERVNERVSVGRAGRRGEIYRSGWAKSHFLRSLAREKQKLGERLKTPEELATFLFSQVANATVLGSDGVRINVQKKNLVGVFNVAMEHTASFFRDRDRVITANGKAARIFHATRAHFRTLPDGRHIPIRMHFRGLRRFAWNGYDITITVPGKHHVEINDFTAPMTLADDGVSGTGMLTAAAFGDEMKKHIIR